MPASTFRAFNYWQHWRREGVIGAVEGRGGLSVKRSGFPTWVGAKRLVSHHVQCSVLLVLCPVQRYCNSAWSRPTPIWLPRSCFYWHTRSPPPPLTSQDTPPGPTPPPRGHVHDEVHETSYESRFPVTVAVSDGELSKRFFFYAGGETGRRVRYFRQEKNDRPSSTIWSRDFQCQA